ncbi:MAG: hypothetical protein J5803_04305 [Desulfovibrio sp.]|nr:hypothetical protein [Desulfovibrio sp.]
MQPTDSNSSWKPISRSEKKLKPSPASPLAQRIAQEKGSTSYHLFRNEPYCILEDAVYMMLPVDEPSLGYKLIDASLDKKTLFEAAIHITENQALNTLHQDSSPTRRNK